MRLTLAVMLGTASCLLQAPLDARTPLLRAFTTDKELAAFLKKRAAPYRRTVSNGGDAYAVPSVPVPAPAAMSFYSMAPRENIVVTGDAAAPASITNTQEVGVDEGGIVKQYGDYLVVLRRGRLFTVSLRDGGLRPVARIDAFPPGTSGRRAWYDEMLIAGDRVVVVGYSYDRGGTEINRFRIGPDGQLRFEDSHHLRSNDYYSSSNYASRLIGSKLVFYTPLSLNIFEPIARQLPAMRRWTGSRRAAFQRIAPATSIYLPEPLRRSPDADVDELHTVTTCDLAAARLACKATAVLGSASSLFYVSGRAVYVWIADAIGAGRRSKAMVYRLPLDGGRPGAAQALGGPVDQFSFRESQPRRQLQVLVRAEGRGDRMWRGEVTEGAPALLSLPLDLFGDGTNAAPRRAYLPLPLADRESWSFHNRFVGDHLVYAAGEFSQTASSKAVFVVPLDGGPPRRLSAPHGVDRIDIMGTDAVVIGNDNKEQLGFTAIELTGAAPRVGATSFLPAAREGERRSQAFFYRPDPESADGASGILGLPISRSFGTSPTARFLGSGSAVAFIQRKQRRFELAGELAAKPEDAHDDGCEASCVDWYGNARPIFLGARIFALMGYEMVEGRLRDDRVLELRRADFAPIDATHGRK
jgi:hypothetical protein